MTPAEFHKDVATPNTDALGNDFGDMRLAVNAILVLDALVGIIHADRHQRGLASGNDLAFRDKLADKHVECALVRDTAFTLKHGELQGKKPRLVQRADQVASYGGAFDEALFDRSAFDTEAVIWIEANDPAQSSRADIVTRAVLDILETMV